LPSRAAGGASRRGSTATRPDRSWSCDRSVRFPVTKARFLIHALALGDADQLAEKASLTRSASPDARSRRRSGRDGAGDRRLAGSSTRSGMAPGHDVSAAAVRRWPSASWGRSRSVVAVGNL
jgi:hypothetical protein